MRQMVLTMAGWGRQARAVDPVWATIAVLFAALAIVTPDQAGRTALFTGEALVSVAPFLLLAVAAASYAKATGADALIARAFQGRVAATVVFAALAGALSPFCSCGVIPLIAALLAMGVPLAPVMAFWLASPLMDPSMFALTAGTLGAGFAVGKTFAAFAIGAMGGFGTLALMRLPSFADPLRAGVGDGGCGGAVVRTGRGVVWKFWREAPRRAAFAREGRASSLFLAKWLTLAFILESLMLAYIPADTIGSVAGDGGPLSVFVAALVGVPAYLNGYAALPLVAGLIDSGMAPGAGMAFLLAGGVTSIPAAMAVFALARPPVCAAYLAFALAGSVLAGLAYGAVA